MTAHDAAPVVDHPNAIALVNGRGVFTPEGLRLWVRTDDPARKEALRDQALRQEVFGKAP